MRRVYPGVSGGPDQLIFANYCVFIVKNQELVV